MNFISKHLNLIILIAAVVAAVFLWDYIVEVILGLLGLKAAQVKIHQQMDKAQSQAEVYQEQADIRVIEAAQEIDKAVASQQSAVEIASKQPEPAKEREGFKRKSIRSS